MHDFINRMTQYTFTDFLEMTIGCISASFAMFLVIGFTIWAIFHTVRFFIAISKG